MRSLLLLLAACTGEVADTGPDTVGWSRTRPRLADAVTAPRGLVPARVIAHLHSAWSHDACDGEPLVDGEPNAPCLADLRQGLCEAGIDVAFLSDHPDHAAWQPYGALWHPAAGDVPVTAGGAPIGASIACDDGTLSTWFPGFEDVLMPLGIEAHVPGSPEERHRLYNEGTPDALGAMAAAGADVYVAHTEQRDVAWLAELQDAGLTGVEIFNAHAMFAPDLRETYLGLDGLGWATAIGPFTRPDSTAEPDLLFLGVLDVQPPSLRAFDALLARGPIVGIAGSDAHQNVLPLVLRDGERVDSYRRALTWFSNHVLADSADPRDVERALAAGRSAVVFEVLGVPDGFDLVLDTGAGLVEMGGTSDVGGDLVVTCPTLAASSPHGVEAPEIGATVYKDGEVWAEGCGVHPTDGPGAYRVQVDVVPWHLTPFLGDDPTPYLRPFPWILSNAIRIR